MKYMKKKLAAAVLLVAFLANMTGCIVSTQYDHHYHMSRPHAMMRRPHPVRERAGYMFAWSPFGGSSSSHREHWPRQHGSRYNRTKVWPKRYVVHPHYHSVKRS
jgi:hypothetical protein